MRQLTAPNEDVDSLVITVAYVVDADAPTMPLKGFGSAVLLIIHLVKQVTEGNEAAHHVKRGVRHTVNRAAHVVSFHAVMISLVITIPAPSDNHASGQRG